MAGNPSCTWFWNDHEADAGLKLCSLAAQGLWMRMLCVAARHDPIGYVAVAGRKLELGEIAQIGSIDLARADELLGELERNRVFSRDRKGRIYNRRMVRDDQKRREAKRNGKLGGNPSLCKDAGKSRGVNPRDKPGVKAQEPSLIHQRKLPLVSVVPRARGAPTEDARAARKQAWKQRIFDELCRRRGPTEAFALVKAFDCGDADAQRLFDDIDRDLRKQRKAHPA